jgi:membrane-associated phospholipid phosphatase
MKTEIGHLGFQPHWLLATLLSIPLVATLFWWLGTRFFESRLSFFEFQEFAVIIAGVTAGGYQLYFWVQRNNQHIRAACLKIPLDDRIPFWPRWIWLYSIFHFVMIGLTVISIQNPADGVHLIFGGLMVLVTGNAIFYFIPTFVPEAYRSFETTNLSTRYLAFIQSMDNHRNAFPSMHCAIAAYVGLVVVDVPTIGPWLGYGYIAVTVISCLLVKQHVIVDTIGGIALGTGMYYANEWLAGYYETIVF